MKKTEILVVCTHAEILNTIIRLINNHADMQGIGTRSIAEAVTVFNSKNFDLILVGSGLDHDEEQELLNLSKSVKPIIPLVFHYGGGSGLLFAEIFEALAKK